MDRGIGGSLRVEILRDPARVWALQPSWEALWHRAEGNYAQAFATCAVAWETIVAPSGGKLHVVACFDNDELVALWPLSRHRRGLWRVLYQIGPRAAEFSDILVESGPHAAAYIAAIWRAVRSAGRCDIVIMPFVKAMSPLGRRLASVPHAVAAPDIAPYVAWRARESWEEYRDTLPRSRRMEYARRWRRLHRKGQLRFEVVRDPWLCRGLVAALLAQKRVWAEHTGKRGPWLYAKRYETFLMDLVARPAPGLTWAMHRLTLDGETIAAMLAVEDACCSHWIISSFSDAHGNLSPGGVLDEYCLHDAHERGLRVEFGPGSEIKKTFWARNEWHETTNHWVPLTWWGILGVALIDGAARLRAWRRGSESPPSPASVPDQAGSPTDASVSTQ
jgi:CelD/BcsL family acetyltransferase involved in cellulose biosynthesis